MSENIKNKYEFNPINTMDEIFLYIPIGIFLGIMIGILITSPDISLAVALIGDVVLGIIAYIYIHQRVFSVSELD